MHNRRMEKLFWGHTTKNQNTVILYFRITIDGQRAELGSTGIQVAKKHWNADAQRITAKTAEAQQQNHTLDILRERAQAIYNDLLMKGEPFSAINIKPLFRQEGRGFSFISLFDSWLRQLKRDPSISAGTWSVYEQVGKKTSAWLRDELKQPDLYADNFTKGILERYRTYMRLDQKRMPSTVRKHTTIIKQIMGWAYLHDYITRDVHRPHRPCHRRRYPCRL